VNTSRFRQTLGLGLSLTLVLPWCGAALAEPPAPPKLSTLVPAGELVDQARLYAQGFETALANEKEYAEDADKLKKDANTLIVVALVLGNYDQPNDLKAAAPALLKAAQQLAKAKDYAAAKAALAPLQAAMATGPMATGPDAKPDGELKWEKVASQGQLMKQATLINTKLRSGMRRFDAKKMDELARQAAVLTAIGQATVYDTHEVGDDPEDLAKWYKLAAEMRDVAANLNAQIRARNKAGATDAVAKVAKNCEACHEVFHPE
jgi:hypothetical protein